MSKECPWKGGEEDATNMNTDTQRLDFLASTEQFICNVMLPTDIAESNVHSLRDAIDQCMARHHKPKAPQTHEH